MGHRAEYIIHGSLPPDRDELPFRHKSLSTRKDSRNASDLRLLYRNSASPPVDQLNGFEAGINAQSPTTPNLPLTPPGADEDGQAVIRADPAALETIKVRSRLVTPVNNNSPPTPDNTPPRDEYRKHFRPFLGAQPSMTSTGAESFRTARENLYSDDESEPPSPGIQSDRVVKVPRIPSPWNEDRHKPSPLARMYSSEQASEGHVEINQTSSPLSIPSLEITLLPVTSDQANAAVQLNGHGEDSLDQNEPRSIVKMTKTHSTPQNQASLFTPSLSMSPGPMHKTFAKRGKSLRERLEDAKELHQSTSTEKFANIIGWTDAVQTNTVNDSRRWSGISTTSTVEAFVVDNSPISRKRTTLRHVGKNDSLRSASSPIPTSGHTSLQSTSASPHRLVHKKAKLNNKNRWSLDSDTSRSVNLVLSPPLTKLEVINVAVIPERTSSLQSSAHSSGRHSRSASVTSEANQIYLGSSMHMGQSRKKRTMSETTERGRDRRYPPQVPARGSSLSAPTSRSTSRANSITSENFRVQRQKAEKDLRKTLDKMESERLISSLNSFVTNTPTASGIPKDLPSSSRSRQQSTTDYVQTNQRSPVLSPDQMHQMIDGVMPGTKEWADLRPSSMLLDTPFSQPSYLSASPEISEAKIVSFYPHNNDSVQLIEPLPLPESRAVRAVRKNNMAALDTSVMPNVEQHNGPLLDTGRLNTDSPLRNPRRPPETPRLKVVPPTPVQDNGNQSFPRNSRFATSKQRPILNDRSQSESFRKSLVRNFSTRSARNKKAGQDLDSSLNPFWRPRPFWDDVDHGNSGSQETSKDEKPIKNSLGLPQDKIVISGPVSLVRRVSQRRWKGRPKQVAKQSSYSSLGRLRASRKMYGSEGGFRLLDLHLPRIGDIQDRLMLARQRKEEGKREKRREELRTKIGSTVVIKGDSRFLPVDVE